MAQLVFRLFTPVSRVVNIPSKLASLQVIWVKSFLVGRYHPWKCFFRHFLHRAFLSEPVERVFQLPTIGTSTLKRLPPFYHQVLSAWLLMEPPADLFTSPVKPCKFATYQLDWPALWKDLDLYFINKPIWKTNFLLIHGILPSADRLARWGIPPRTLLCHCGLLETQEHLYEHCTHPGSSRLVRGVVGMKMA